MKPSQKTYDLISEEKIFPKIYDTHVHTPSLGEVQIRCQAQIPNIQFTFC